MSWPRKKTAGSARISIAIASMIASASVRRRSARSAPGVTPALTRASTGRGCAPAGGAAAPPPPSRREDLVQPQRGRAGRRLGFGAGEGAGDLGGDLGFEALER